jgi:hypothetical protein
MVIQASLSDGVSFDPFTFEQDCLTSHEMDVGSGEHLQASIF